MIQAKARDFYQKVKNEQDFSNMTQTESKETFTASNGWFQRFKERNGISLPGRHHNEQNGNISK